MWGEFEFYDGKGEIMDIANYRVGVMGCGVNLVLLINQYSAILNSHRWRVLGETCDG